MRLSAFVILLVLMLVAAVAVVVVRETAAAAQEQLRSDSDGSGEVVQDAVWGDREDLTLETAPVVVSIEGQHFNRITNATTVRDLLVQMGIVLDEDHAISHDLDAEVLAGTRIVIARIETGSVTEDAELSYDTREVEDATLSVGARVVQTAGRNGTATTSFLVRYADGIEVLRTEVLSTVTEEPRTEVIRVGTGNPGSAPNAGSNTPNNRVPAPNVTTPAPEPTRAPTTAPTQEPTTAPTQTPTQDPAPKPKPTPSKPAPPAPKPTPTPTPTPTKPPSTQEPDVGAGIGPGTTPASAKALAKSMAASRGWGASEFSCLETLWHRESSWNFKAKNPSSTARGIPQAMMSIHFGKNWRTDPAALAYLRTPELQITWGLNYIQRHRNFSTPCGALDFWNDNNWY